MYIRTVAAVLLTVAIGATGCSSTTDTKPSTDEPSTTSAGTTAEDKAIWDTSWNQAGAEAQANVCKALQIEGAEAAALGLTGAQAEYYRDNKC